MSMGKLTTGAALAVLSALAACRSTPKELPPSDAAPPIARPAASAASAPAGPIGSVAISGNVDRPRAQQIGLDYAKAHWPQLQPSFATAFILHDGSFKVVVAFDKSSQGASIYVRSTDGEVTDASISGSTGVH